MSVAEISEFLGLSGLKTHTYHIQGCCALTGEGYLIHLCTDINSKLVYILEWIGSFNN